jgi:hypothetical protein
MSLTQFGPFNQAVHTNLSCFAHIAQLFLRSQVATLEFSRCFTHLWKPCLHSALVKCQAPQST